MGLYHEEHSQYSRRSILPVVLNMGPLSSLLVPWDPMASDWISHAREALAFIQAEEVTVVICTVGTLTSDANLVLSVNLRWSTGGTTASISASATSELPDPVAADNTQVFEVALGSINGDVPTLPEWGMIVLLILLGSMSLFGPAGGARRR